MKVEFDIEEIILVTGYCSETIYFKIKNFETPPLKLPSNDKRLILSETCASGYGEEWIRKNFSLEPTIINVNDIRHSLDSLK